MSKRSRKKAPANAQEIQNAAITMLANIRFVSIDNPIQSIVVTSAVPNEGKTTTTVELAKAIAASGHSVLLVEADMRHRSVAALIKVHPAQGAYAVMAGLVSLEDAIVATDIPNLSFLDIEPKIPNPADLLSSHAYSRLVDEVCKRYDYVLFDTPPVGTFVDAAILSRLVDGVILVVKIGGPKRDEIRAAYDQLERADAFIIGACATFCEGTSSEYYYAYYDKNNKRIDSKHDPAPYVAASLADPATGLRNGVQEAEPSSSENASGSAFARGAKAGSHGQTQQARQPQVGSYAVPRVVSGGSRRAGRHGSNSASRGTGGKGRL